MSEAKMAASRPGKKTARSTDIAPEVGERLRMVRSLILDNRSRFAAMYKVTYSNWQKWEEGRSYPDPAVMVAFCEDWDVTMDWLYRARPDGLKSELLSRLYRHFPKEMEQQAEILKAQVEAAARRRAARFGGPGDEGSGSSGTNGSRSGGGGTSTRNTKAAAHATDEL